MITKRRGLSNITKMEAHIFNPSIVSTTDSAGMLYHQPKTEIDRDGFAYGRSRGSINVLLDVTVGH